MLKILMDQWKANQEQKRAIAAERWEQEKRWREEDRDTTRQKQVAAQERVDAESQKKEEEAARQEETYRLVYREHLRVLKKAATVSYVSLNCHEDTWTFLARRAFGTWSPEWLTSVSQDSEETENTGPQGKAGFIKDPNLVPGRITKHANGMQTVEVSGANLVAILESLWEGAYSRNIYKALTDFDPNRRACGPLHTRFSDWLDNLEAGLGQRAGTHACPRRADRIHCLIRTPGPQWGPEPRESGATVRESAAPPEMPRSVTARPIPCPALRERRAGRRSAGLASIWCSRPIRPASRAPAPSRCRA